MEEEVTGIKGGKVPWLGGGVRKRGELVVRGGKRKYTPTCHKGKNKAGKDTVLKGGLTSFLPRVSRSWRKRENTLMEGPPRDIFWEFPQRTGICGED